MYKRGVYYHKLANKWTSQIKIDGKKKHLGLFDLFDEAVKAREQAESLYFYKDINFYKNLISQEDVKELLNYEPDTGTFTWRINYGGHIVRGRKAGGIDTDSRTGGKAYYRIKLYKKMYMAHRLAYLYMTGEFPETIDHINGNGLDNRWCNLRNVSLADNNKNARLQVNNKSGVIGVSWNKRVNQWQASININGIQKYLGIYKDFFEACCARKSAEIKHKYHKNHGQIRPL
jgi:hypothetical protein